MLTFLLFLRMKLFPDISGLTDFVFEQFFTFQIFPDIRGKTNEMPGIIKKYIWWTLKLIESVFYP